MYKFAVFPGNNGEAIRRAMVSRGWEEVDPASADTRNVNFIWKPTNLSTRYILLEEHLKVYPWRLVLLNHCENNRLITTKTGLLRQLRTYYAGCDAAIKAGYLCFDSTPTSYILTAGYQDREYFDFLKRYGEIEKGNFAKDRVPAKHLAGNMWILKPANMNQGRGIQLFKTLRELNSSLQSKPSLSQWVAQKYLQKPLLYKGRKFDIRVWVVLTQRRDIYVFNQPYIRTSSSIYSTERLDGPVHLTNNCLQKHCEDYSKFEEGNTLPLSALEAELRGQERYRGYRPEMIMGRVRDLIIDTLQAAKSICHLAKKVQFQLLGYDFMVDQDLRTWLIEVNVNPYLGVPNDYIKNLLPQMIDQMLALVLDPVFHPKAKKPTPLFDLVFSDELNLRSPFTAPLYPLEALAQPPNRRAEEEPKKKDSRALDEVIQSLLDSYIFEDFDPFHQPVSKLMGKLDSLKSLPQKENATLLRALGHVLRSRIVTLTLEQKYQQVLLRLIQPDEQPQQLIVSVLSGFLHSIKETFNKKKMKVRQLMKRLAPLIQRNLLSGELKEAADSAVKLMLLLNGQFNRVLYIPGQTRELEGVRQSVISCGGLTLLLGVEALAKDQGLISAVRNNLDKLELTDWDAHLRVEPPPEIREFEVALGLDSATLCMKRYRLLQDFHARNKELERQRVQRNEEQLRRQQRQKQRLDLQRKQQVEEYIRRKKQERQKMLLSAKVENSSPLKAAARSIARQNVIEEEGSKGGLKEPLLRREASVDNKNSLMRLRSRKQGVRGEQGVGL